MSNQGNPKPDSKPVGKSSLWSRAVWSMPLLAIGTALGLGFNQVGVIYSVQSTVLPFFIGVAACCLILPLLVLAVRAVYKTRLAERIDDLSAALPAALRNWKQSPAEAIEPIRKTAHSFLGYYFLGRSLTVAFAFVVASVGNAILLAQLVLHRSQTIAAERQTVIAAQQTDILKRQNELIHTQSELTEAQRRASYTTLVSNHLERVDKEHQAWLATNPKDPKGFTLSTSLAAQIAAVSRQLHPYRILGAEASLSPERGMLLVSLLHAPGDTLSRVNDAGADFSAAQLTNVDLRGAKLVGANLRGASLRGANLTGAVLARCNLTGCDLRKTDLDYVVVWNSSLDECDLSEAESGNAVFVESRLTSATLKGTRLWGATLFHCDLSRSDLTSADLSSSVVVYCTLESVNPSGLIMWGMEQNVFGLLSMAGDDIRRVDPAGVPRLSDTELRKREKQLGGRDCLFYGNVVSRSQVPPAPWVVLQHEYGNKPLLKTVEGGVLLHNVPDKFAMELGIAEARFPKWLTALREEELRREQTFTDPTTKQQPAYMVPRHPRNTAPKAELRLRGSTGLPSGAPIILGAPK